MDGDLLIYTRPKVVICTKLDPKTGECQTWPILPLYQVLKNSRYLPHITGILGFKARQYLKNEIHKKFLDQYPVPQKANPNSKPSEGAGKHQNRLLISSG